jgi:acyl-CoA synthetase (AMP-forming)/AMP-acid ligase II
MSERPGASGKPVPLSQVALVDDEDRPVAVGTPGEIVVRGPLVFQGYFDQPEVTAHTFRNGWHHTGDVGRFDADGYLYYVKRKPEKELIKPGGENVYPAEVETVIMQMEGVSGVCVYGVPDARWGEAIKAVVEVSPADRHSGEQVADFVASRIAVSAAPPRGLRTPAADGRWLGRSRAVKVVGLGEADESEGKPEDVKIFNEQHDMFGQTVRSFVEKRIEATHIEEWEQAGQIPKSIWPRLGELGFLGVEYDEKYGGAGADFPTTMVLCEEMARSRSGSLAMAVGVHTDMASPHLYWTGSEALK